MICQICGVEIRQDSKFCHKCGIPLKAVDISKGGSLIRFAFIFTVILPTLQSVCTFIITVVVIPEIFSLQLLNIFIIAILFTSFMLANRGKQWAATSTGIIIIFSGFLYFVLAILSYPNNEFFLTWGILGILYIALGFSLVMSKDVLAFVKYKATKDAG